MDAINAVNSLVASWSEVTRGREVGINEPAPPLAIRSTGQGHIDLEGMRVEGSIDIWTAFSLDSESKEPRFVVIPVVLVPDNVRRREERVDTEGGVAFPKVDQARHESIEASLGGLFRLERHTAPVHPCHLVVMAVPVIVAIVSRGELVAHHNHWSALGKH